MLIILISTKYDSTTDSVYISIQITDLLTWVKNENHFNSTCQMHYEKTFFF